MKERGPKPREDEPTRMLRWWWGYVVAVAGTALAALVRWALGQVAGHLPTYTTFYPVVLAASLIGGIRPGLLATALSLLAANLFFMEPVGKLGLATMGQAVGMGLFTLVNIGICILAGRFRMQSKALRESEGRLRQFIDEAPVAIAMLDKEMRYLAASRQWLVNFHLPNQSLLGRSHYEVFPELPERWKQTHRRCLAGAVERADEDLFERADGRRQWVRWEVRPWYAAPDRIGGLLIFSEEITARVEALQALRESEEHFRTMADVIPQLAWIARADGYIFWYNRRCFEYTGATLAQLEGWGWESVVHPRTLPRVLERWQRSIATAEPYDNLEAQLRGADGRFRPFITCVAPLKDHAGRVVLWFGTATNITELQETQEELRQSEERFHQLAEHIPQLAWMTNADGEIFWYNQRWLDYTGTTLEEMQGWGWQKVLHPKDVTRVTEKFQRALASQEPWEDTFPLRSRSGGYRWFLSRAFPLRDENGKVVRWFGTNTDITGQKQAETEIIALRDRLAADLAGMNRLHELSTRFVRQGDMETLLDAILDAGIALTGADKGHVQLFDPASGKVDLTDQRGFTPAFVEYSSHIRPGVLATGLALQTHQRVVVEDVTASPLFLADPRALQLVLEAGMRSVVSVPLLTRTGQLVGTVSILFAVPHQPSERDLRLLDLLARQAADFLERTRAEESLRAARLELAQANADLERKVEERTAKLREAMAELEHMSYSMVHDMRAPLRAMQGFADILQEECADCRLSPGLDYLGRIREASNRLDRLITDALNYNRVVRENLPITPVELGSLLRGMVGTYPNLQPPAAAIAIDVDDLVVLGNESLLTQCFGNLLDNAVKFVAPGVRPCVRIWAEPSTLSDQPAFTICIQDNGIGVPKEAQDRIFRMFQRMHCESEYPGTGIGLTIVRKAVERMNGHVSLHSEPGQGTCFRIDLPRPTQAQDTERLQDAA